MCCIIELYSSNIGATGSSGSLLVGPAGMLRFVDLFFMSTRSNLGRQTLVDHPMQLFAPTHSRSGGPEILHIELSLGGSPDLRSRMSHGLAALASAVVADCCMGRSLLVSSSTEHSFPLEAADHLTCGITAHGKIDSRKYTGQQYSPPQALALGSHGPCIFVSPIFDVLLIEFVPTLYA